MFIFVPLYIKLLGVESYGIVAFYAVLLSILVVADAGLTATLSREFAREDIPDKGYKPNLLRTFEYIYLGIAALIVVGVTIFSDAIATNFIKTDAIALDDIAFYVSLMGIVAVMSMVTSLYNGGLMGIQRQVLSNTLSIVNSCVRAAVIVPLIWIPTLDFYFYWQIGVALLYLLTVRYFLVRYIPASGPVRANFGYLKNVWKYALGMILLSAIAAGNTQMDKLVVGNLLTLTDFTSYTLSSMVGQVIVFLAVPISVAMFPELTRLVSLKDTQKTKELFHKYALITSVVTSAIAMVVLCYTYDYILIWTHKPEIASAIETSTKVLVVGSLFLSFQYMPYNMAMANGHTRTNVTLGAFVFVALIPLLYWLIPYFGVVGAAIPWLIINVMATVVLGWILLGKFLPGEFGRWLVGDTLVPLALSGAVAAALYGAFYWLPQGYWTLAYGAVIFVAVLVVDGLYLLKRYPEMKRSFPLNKIFR